MSSHDPDRLPDPPADPPADWEPPVLRLDFLWRVHWEPPDDVLNAPAKAAKYRFDDPEGRFAVTYANSTEVGAFVEVYGSTQRIDAAQRDRLRSELEATRELVAIDLDQATTQKAFGLDGRIGTAVQYETTQRWSRAFYDWFPNADCISYRSRHEGATLNLCLFLDRCRDAFRIVASERLEDIDRVDLLRLVLPYRIVVDW